MKKHINFLFVIIAFCTLFSCKTQHVCSNAEKAKLKNISGLDGCSWVIELEDGSVLEPMNLKEFDIKKRNGKKIYVSYKAEPKYVSICMTGPIVRITCIENR